MELRDKNVTRERARESEVLGLRRAAPASKTQAEINGRVRRNRGGCTDNLHREFSPWPGIEHCNICRTSGKCMEDERTFSVYQDS